MRRWFKTYEDVLHIYFSAYLRSLSASELERFSPASRWQRFKLSLKIGQKRLMQLTVRNERELEKLEGKIWLFVVSKNNLDAFSFLCGQLPNSILVADKDRAPYIGYQRIIPTLKFQLLHLFKYPLILGYLTYKKGPHALRIAPVILRSLGFVEEWTRVLRKATPKAIVFANDHNIESRSLLMAAKALKIPTIYLQHASVSSSFPPLVFDLNLLEGQDTLDKYKAIAAINGTVHLVGMPKFDKYAKLRKERKKIRSIGIPYNLNDNRQALIDLTKSLREAFPQMEITVRRHPKDQSNFSIGSVVSGLAESDPSRETAFEFLVNQDCIIAGNSSIHLEATLLNILSIYTNLDEGNFIDDYYGFVKNDLILKAESFTDIISIIRNFNENPVDVFFRAKYFNAVVSTEFEGESQKLVISHINNFLTECRF